MKDKLLNRNIFNELLKWTKLDKRKPLVVRGARQVGKTFAIKSFAHQNFSNSIYLNLEKAADRQLFSEVRDCSSLIRDIEVISKQKIQAGQTLLFIDEIQNSKNAMNQLRYFYEEMPELHVIAAGSLLEIMLEQKKLTIPVGRVEYKYMYPLRFDEFLLAIDENSYYHYLNEIDNFEASSSIHNSLLRKFQEYLLVGGMPEAVAKHSFDTSLSDLDPIYESLMTGFRDDIHKYTSTSKALYLAHVLENVPKFVGLNIKYEKFADSSYKGNDISMAFLALEKAMLVNRVRASTSLKLPLNLNSRISPKVLFLDVGLVNYITGNRQEFLENKAIEDVYRGQIAEQVVGQTLISRLSSRQASFILLDKK